MGDETVEQTLIVCREAALYKISPRSSGGHKSGDWLVTDKIFSGRVRVIAKGELAEVRIEDPNWYAAAHISEGWEATRHQSR